MTRQQLEYLRVGQSAEECNVSVALNTVCVPCWDVSQVLLTVVIEHTEFYLRLTFDVYIVL